MLTHLQYAILKTMNHWSKIFIFFIFFLQGHEFDLLGDTQAWGKPTAKAVTKPLRKNKNTQAQNTKKPSKGRKPTSTKKGSGVIPLPQKKPPLTSENNPVSNTLASAPGAATAIPPIIPLKKPSLQSRINQCDQDYKSNFAANDLKKIESTAEYMQYRDACQIDENLRTPDWEGKGPGDPCILHTTLLASKIFDIDFPLVKCIILKESGDYKNSKKQVTGMADGNEDNREKREIKVNASEGNGNGLGQITLPAYKAVMELVDPSDNRVKNNYFSCDVRKKFLTFFNVTNGGEFPEYKNKDLKDFHPALNLAVSLAYLSAVLPKELGHRNGLPKAIRFDSHNINKDPKRQFHKDTSRLPHQLYAEEYNRSPGKKEYRKLVSKCIENSEEQYIKMREGTITSSEINKLKHLNLLKFAEIEADEGSPQ